MPRRNPGHKARQRENGEAQERFRTPEASISERFWMAPRKLGIDPGQVLVAVALGSEFVFVGP
jgi:hypothetical protein